MISDLSLSLSLRLSLRLGLSLSLSLCLGRSLSLGLRFGLRLSVSLGLRRISEELEASSWAPAHSRRISEGSGSFELGCSTTRPKSVICIGNPAAISHFHSKNYGFATLYVQNVTKAHVFCTFLSKVINWLEVCV